MKRLSETTLQTFRVVPEVVEGFLDGIPEEELDIRRSDRAWTAREHLYHMVDVQEMLLARINLIIEKENPVIDPFFPEEEKIRSYASREEALALYREMRERQYGRVKNLSPEILQKEALHGEYREYNIPKIINHMIFHEYWHMYRIEEICHTRDGYFE